MYDIKKLKQLRQETGISFSLCKKSLEGSKNNLEEAKKLLKKWGIAKAKDKSDRTTSAGAISATDDRRDRIPVPPARPPDDRVDRAPASRRGVRVRARLGSRAMGLAQGSPPDLAAQATAAGHFLIA